MNREQAIMSVAAEGYVNKRRVTPHQREVLARLTRVSERLGGAWVPERHIGSHGALWHLVSKGRIEAREVIGPRGGTTYEYRPVKEAS